MSAQDIGFIGQVSDFEIPWGCGGEEMADVGGEMGFVIWEGKIR